MKGKIWIISLVVIVSVILLGVVGLKIYNENVDNQISEGAKKEAVRYFEEEERKEYIPKETEFVKEMSSIRVYGYFKDNPKQKYHATMTYGKTDNGYDFDIGSTGEVYADKEEYLEQQKEQKE